ncbi:MAG: hypothetical protein HQ521_21285 [Bacteroidetes bacterium]|nr:hypothetical protein [Bacteroidota bacterium]
MYKILIVGVFLIVLNMACTKADDLEIVEDQGEEVTVQDTVKQSGFYLCV